MSDKDSKKIQENLTFKNINDKDSSEFNFNQFSFPSNPLIQTMRKGKSFEPSKTQQLANESPQVKAGNQIQLKADNSPQVLQGKKIQTLADSSPQVLQAKRLQESINNSLCVLQEKSKIAQLFSGNDKASVNKISSNSGNTSKMPATIQTKMENSFGEDFSGVNIHTNSEQANQLNALAYTQGNDIHFAPGQYNPESKSGQELLGHELTHVVQQKQGRVNSTSQFKGVQINNDSALENEADEMGRKAAEGKDATVQLQAKDNAIQRYEIEGPWNKNEPIHEHITLYALIQAGIVNADTAYDDDKVWEFTRGAIWNDDPEGLLFDNNSEENKNWSSGVVWYNHFSDGKSKATKGQSIGVNDNLTARSHFGDLQFIHAMAVKEGVKASSTKSKIMMWSEFVYKTGIGVIKEDTLLKNVPVAGIPDLFPGKLGELTIRQLFHVHESGSTQKRCMGSLLHMIQDSYAEGHAERETVNNKKEDVVSFHSYTNQDSHKHGEKDGIQEGSKGTMREKIAKIPGANDAIDKCAVVLKMYHAAKPWEEVKPILEYQIFKLKNPDNLSSAGEDFEKDPKHVYESFKSWGTLDEESLGKKLSSLAIEKPQLVLDVLNKEVAYVDQDDVAYYFVKHTPESKLKLMDKKILKLLYKCLDEGWTTEDESNMMKKINKALN